MDAPGQPCPTCGTPRGAYDRFCTGCGLDLGAPGELLLPGLRGTSSGAARSTGQAPTASRTAPGRPAPVVGSYAPIARGSASDWSGPTGTQFPSMIPGAGAAVSSRVAFPTALAAEPGARLWWTLAVANRLFAVTWIAIIVLAYTARPTATSAFQADPLSLLIGYAFVGLVPAAFLWFSYRPLTVGRSGLTRAAVLLEMLVLLPFTFGLVLIPLVAIYVILGARGTTA